MFPKISGVSRTILSPYLYYTWTAIIYFYVLLDSIKTFALNDREIYFLSR
jgi:hypothetical protein